MAVGQIDNISLIPPKLIAAYYGYESVNNLKGGSVDPGRPSASFCLLGDARSISVAIDKPLPGD